ncbi:MAG: membrane dipeptidase [Betaproteobacteria bacterium]|nr:membrane dipeptidase [Betaproteobacteria bacterium]
MVKKLTREQEEHALDLYRKATVIHGAHASVTTAAREDAQRMVKSGLTASCVTVATPLYDDNFRRQVEAIIEHHRWIRSYPDLLLRVSSVSDIEKSKKEGKTGIIFALQNLWGINDATMVEAFYLLGIKMINLAYQKRNYFAGGASDLKDEGLSELGVLAVEEMNRLGMVIDVCHCSRATAMDAIEVSKHPVVNSHAAARALNNSSHNRTDDELKTMAEKGGVIGLIAFGPCVAAKDGVQASMDDYFTHLDYLVKLIGADHVGIGLDLFEDEERKRIAYPAYMKKFPELLEGADHVTRDTKGMETCACFPEIAKGLVARGYSDQDILKIMGGNFLRVFKQVWRA